MRVMDLEQRAQPREHRGFRRIVTVEDGRVWYVFDCSPLRLQIIESMLLPRKYVKSILN